MWGLLVAAALTFGLVRAAVTKPARKLTHEERRLVALTSGLAAGVLSLEDAEDGAVLARRQGDVELEKKFRIRAVEMKKRKM